MKTLIATTLLASAAMTTTWVDAKQSKAASTEQNVGFASGAVVGAATAGPIGFIIGAVAGALIGDEVAEGKEAQAQLAVTTNEKQQLNAQVQQLQSQLNSVESKQTVDGSDMLQMDVLFQTAATELSSSDVKKVEQLAGFLTRYPSLAIKLDGFADARGLPEQNQALSEQRVSAVKSILIEQGVNPERIFTRAHGEEKASQVKSPDAYALDRRVSVRFFTQNEQSVAEK
ncbi:MAG: OmpA family protein [Gammaproteobacteria bacterium]|nr:OmpA family protein [Gammaproteobacteria bacterium]NVK86957.1 OmpA family protein [Gammaproteobacteria bacterium]